MLTRGAGNILSATISSQLVAWKAPNSNANSTSVEASWEHERTGFDVGGGRFEKVIIYVGTCFAGAAGIALLGWGLDVRNRASRMRTK